MDAVELARWTRFAAKGGIGKCTATQDCIAEVQEDLMFLKNDEITVLMHLNGQPDRYLGFCEGVVGRFLGAHVRFHGKLKRPVMTKRASSTASTSAASPVPSSSPSPRVSLSSLAARETSDSPIPPLSQSQIDKQRRVSSRAERGRDHAKEHVTLTQKSRSPSRDKNDGDGTFQAVDDAPAPPSSSPFSPSAPRRRKSEEQDGQSSEKANRRRTHIVGEFAGMYSPPPSRSASDDKSEIQDDEANSEKNARRRTRIIGDFGTVFSAPLVESPPPSPRPPVAPTNDEDGEVLNEKARKRRTGLVGEFALSPLILSPSPFTTEFKFPPERPILSPPLAPAPRIELSSEPRSTSPDRAPETTISNSTQEIDVPDLAISAKPEQTKSEDDENHDHRVQDGLENSPKVLEEKSQEIDSSFYDRASLNSNSTDESSLFHINSSSVRDEDNIGEPDLTLTTVNNSTSKMDITIDGVTDDDEDADGGLGLGLAMLQDMADADSDESDSEEEWVRRRVGFIRTPEPSPKLPPPGFGTHQPATTLTVGKSPLSEVVSENTVLTPATVESTNSIDISATTPTEPTTKATDHRDSSISSEANVNIITSEDEDLNEEGEWDGADDIYDNYRYSRYSMYSTKKLRYSMMSKSSSLNEADADSPLPPMPSEASLQQQPQRQILDDSSSLKSSSVEASPSKAHKHLPPPLKLVPSPATSATTLLSPLPSAVPSTPASSLTSPVVNREFKPLTLDIMSSTLHSSALSPASSDQPSTNTGLGRPLTPLLSPLSPAPSVSSFSGRLGGAASALRQKLESERSTSRDPTPVPPESETEAKPETNEEPRKIVVDDEEDITITRNLLKREIEEDKSDEQRVVPVDHEVKNSRTSIESTTSEQSTVSTVPTISSDIVKEMQRMEADLAALERRQAELTSKLPSSSAATPQAEPAPQPPIRSPEKASFNIPSTQPLRINHDRAQRSPVTSQFSPSALDSTAPPPPYTQSQSEPPTDVKIPFSPIPTSESSAAPVNIPPVLTQTPSLPSAQTRPTQNVQVSHNSQQPPKAETQPLQISSKQEQGPSQASSAFRPHPNAPRPNPAVASGQRTSTVGMPPVHVDQSQPSKPTYNSLQSTLQMAAAARVGPNGAIRNTTIYGKTLSELATSNGPVPIIWSLEPFVIPKSSRVSQVPKRSATTAVSPLGAEVQASPPMGPSVPTIPPSRASHSAQFRSPLSLKPGGDPAEDATPRSSKVIPRANFFPRAGGARPRSRSFSGLTSEFTSPPKSSTQTVEEGTSRQPTRIASMQSLKGNAVKGNARQSSTSPTNFRNPSVPSPLSLPQNNTVADPTIPGASSFTPSSFPSSPMSPTPQSMTVSENNSDADFKSSTLQKLGIRQVASTAALKAGPSAYNPAHDGKRRNSGPAAGSSTNSSPVSGFGLLRRLSSSSKHQRSLSQHSRSSVNSDTNSNTNLPPSNTSVSPSTSTQRSNSFKAKLSLSSLRVRNNSKEGTLASSANEASSSPSTTPATPVFDFDKKETVQVKDTDFEMVTPAIRRISSSASDDIREERPSLQSDLRSESPATMSLRSTVLSPVPGGSQSDNSHGGIAASRSANIPDDAVAMAAHRSREQRWISTMASVSASHALKSKKVKKLVLEGVPASVRYLVWAHLTDSKGKRTPGIYQQLSKRAPVSVIRDIEKDAATYFPDYPFLRNSKGPIVNVLQAYLTMVPDIEYEKSLAIVAGHILLLAPEEDAFWILVSMMDTYLRPYFSSRAVQMEADATVFGKAIDIADPKLAKKLFSDLRLPPIEICRPWFPSILASTLPLEHANRVWDVYLCEGPPFLFRVGIALLSLCRNALETARDGQTVLAILSKPASFSLLPPDPQDLINMAFAVKIRDEEVKKQREKVEAQLKRQTQTRTPALASSILLVRP